MARLCLGRRIEQFFHIFSSFSSFLTIIPKKIDGKGEPRSFFYFPPLFSLFLTIYSKEIAHSPKKIGKFSDKPDFSPENMLIFIHGNMKKSQIPREPPCLYPECMKKCIFSLHCSSVHMKSAVFAFQCTHKKRRKPLLKSLICLSSRKSPY